MSPLTPPTTSAGAHTHVPLSGSTTRDRHGLHLHRPLLHLLSFPLRLHRLLLLGLHANGVWSVCGSRGAAGSDVALCVSGGGATGSAPVVLARSGRLGAAPRARGLAEGLLQEGSAKGRGRRGEASTRRRWEGSRVAPGGASISDHLGCSRLNLAVLGSWSLSNLGSSRKLSAVLSAPGGEAPAAAA